MSKDKSPRKIVRDAIIKLLLNEPFWACILMRLRVLMTDSLVPTLATDGKYLVVNNEWISGRKFEEAMAGLVHEACHIAFKHNLRRGKRNFLIWNYACDYAINQLIKKKKLRDGTETGFNIPPTWLYDARFEGMHAEKIYDILMADIKGGSSAAGNGQWSGPTMFDPNGSGASRPDDGDILFDFPAMTKEEARVAEESIDSALEGIAAQAKQAGKLPGFMKFDLEARHQHVIDYRDILRDWLTKNVFSQDYDWMRCDRRFVGSGFHIPSLVENSDGFPNIILVVDTSGSMLNDRDLSVVGSEIQGVLDEFPGKYFVLYTDTIYQGLQEISYENPLRLHMTGGGGTDFRAIMRHIKGCELEFEAILFFTDMATSSFGDNPDKPVLWMSTSECYETPPFGKVIVIPERRE